jgi:hypothetical protein
MPLSLVLISLTKVWYRYLESQTKWYSHRYVAWEEVRYPSMGHSFQKWRHPTRFHARQQRWLANGVGHTPPPARPVVLTRNKGEA